MKNKKNNGVSLEVNKIELERILKILQNKDSSTRIKIKSSPTGIGSKVSVSVENDKEEHDVSDYDSW